MNQVFAGVGLGLIMALMLGPVFFMLINISIKNGFRAAFFFALGVVLSDGFYISIIEFSKSLVGFIDSHRTWIAVLGGGLLIVFGVSSILKKVVDPKEVVVQKDKGSLDLMMEVFKGFMMNSLNPFVLFFWIGVSTTFVATNPIDKYEEIVFFGSALLTIFITDLIKGSLAIQLKKMMTIRFITVLNKISGAGLILFGMRLFYLLWVGRI
ncbi:MAG: LysE family translocator [Bacteroidota bacterium]